MYTIRKKYRFEGSHILSDADSVECKEFIHGHSYIVEVFVQNHELNFAGMVIDFKTLDKFVKPLIDEWDHKLVMNKDDRRERFTQIANLKMPFNPTAENMAMYFFCEINGNLREIGMVHCLLKVRVHETETGYAEYSPYDMRE